MITSKISILGLLLIFFPLSALAQDSAAPGFVSAPSDFKGFIQIILDIIGFVIPILIGLTAIVFIWGLYLFIPSAASEEEKTKGKKFMVWGIIALFVMVSLWAIIEVLLGSIGIDFLLPQLKTSFLEFPFG